MLDAHHLPQIRSSNRCNKLAQRWIGPFINVITVKAVVKRNSYKLRLPPTLAIHPTINIRYLKRYHWKEAEPPATAIPLPRIMPTSISFDTFLHREGASVLYGRTTFHGTISLYCNISVGTNDVFDDDDDDVKIVSRFLGQTKVQLELALHIDLLLKFGSNASVTYWGRILRRQREKHLGVTINLRQVMLTRVFEIASCIMTMSGPKCSFAHRVGGGRRLAVLPVHVEALVTNSRNCLACTIIL